MKKLYILIILLLSACNSPAFFEDFEDYNLGESTPYVLYSTTHTDEIVDINKSKSYKMTHNAVYRFCTKNVSYMSFDLMIPNFESEIRMFATSYEFKIRQDGSILGEFTLDFLLSTVWHHIDLWIEDDKIQFVLDGNINIDHRLKSDINTDCLVFSLVQPATVYIDNVMLASNRGG